MDENLNRNLKEIERLINENTHEKAIILQPLTGNNVKKLKNFKFEDYMNVSDKIEEYLSILTDEIINTLPEDIDIQSIEFLLYELLINIYKHSKCNNSQIQIKTNDTISISIYDDGIGISGSFDESSIKYQDDSNAILSAINGTTTDKEKYNLHGRGLNTSVNIVTKGFGGIILISSKKGICLVTPNGVKLFEDKCYIKGTLIISIINNIKIDNLYECIKFNKIEKEEYYG